MPLYFVVDIDKTIVIDYKNDLDHLARKNCIRADFFIFDRYYTLCYGAKEFLLFLLSIPGSKIIFFSAGLESRNKQLIRKLFYMLGKQKELSRVKIFSRQHMQAGKKDLTGPEFKGVIKTKEDLMNTIIIDDSLEVIANSANLLHVCFKPVVEYIKYLPQLSLVEIFCYVYFFSEHMLFYASNVIAQACYLRQQRKISLTEAMSSLKFTQKTANEDKQAELMRIIDYIYMGANILNKFNPEIKLRLYPRENIIPYWLLNIIKLAVPSSEPKQTFFPQFSIWNSTEFCSAPASAKETLEWEGIHTYIKEPPDRMGPGYGF